MTNKEARAYFIDSNERIISVAKDENGYNYETQQIENVFMRRDFEAKELAIKALEQTDVLEKIRAEIDDIEEGISSYHNDRPWVFKDEVLRVIDKYRKGGAE